MEPNKLLARLKLALKPFFTTHKQYGIGIVAILFLCTIFLMSKYLERTERVHIVESKREFKNGSVMENRNDLYKKREVQHIKEMRRIKKSQKELSEKVELLAETTTSILDRLDSLVQNNQKSQENANPQPNEVEKEKINPDSQDVELSKKPRGTTQNGETTGIEYHGNSGIQTARVSPLGETGPPQQSASRRKKQRRSRNYRAKPRNEGPAIISFPVKTSKKVSRMGVKLPSGSFAKVKLLTGVSAGNRPIPALLQVDYAFIGPGQKGKTKIDLSGCFMIAKSKGNMSTERLELQITKMSCVSKDGRMFEKKLNGYVADSSDSSFGLKADRLQSNQGRTAALGFAASVVQGISGAIQQSQTTTQANPVGGSSSLVSGSQTKYMVAGGASNAAGLITQWYLNQAKGLEPQIVVNSGKELFVILNDTIDLPSWYFRKSAPPRGEHNSTFTYLTRH